MRHPVIKHPLGFEIDFTTLESRLTTYFTSVKEKKLPTSLNINFLAPNAYAKVNNFKRFIQKYINHTMLFEYYDTSETKHWEGKVQKLGVEELADWGGLVCPLSFMPATPKFLKRNNVIQVSLFNKGKSYSFKYPYSYGRTVIENNTLVNEYFAEVPLKVVIYGKIANPHIALAEVGEDGSLTQYTAVRFDNLTVEENEHLIIDAIRSKVLLWRGGRYISVYDYLSKQSDLDAFLYAKGNTTSKLVVQLGVQDTGYMIASYRQYML